MYISRGNFRIRLMQLGYYNGETFDSQGSIRAYLTVAAIREMFDECDYTQDQLDRLADLAIEHREHME